MKNRRKSAFLATVSFLALATMTACGANSESLIEYINNDDFAGAVDYWSEKVNRTKKEDEIAGELMEFMDSNYSAIASKYSDGTLTKDSLDDLADLAEDASFDTSETYLSFLSDISAIDASVESYNRGVEYFDSEDYDAAISCFESVSKVDTAHYSLAQDKIAEVDEVIEQKKLDKIQGQITEIQENIGNKKFYDANSKLSSIKYDYGDMDIVKQVEQELEDAVIADADENVQKYFSEFDYRGAKDYLSDLRYSFSYNTLEDKYDSISDDYIDYALAEAKKEADSENYENAMAILSSVLDDVGDTDDKKVRTAYDEYKSFTPIYITEMDYMESDGDSSAQEVSKDNIGTTYKSGFYLDRWGKKECYETFYINGKYKTFSGTVAVASGQKDSKDTKYFEVWGDGTLIYTSPTLTKGSLPEEFSVDISGVKQLKIVYPPTDGSNGIATIFDGLFTPLGKDEVAETTTEAATTEAVTETEEVSEDTTTTVTASEETSEAVVETTTEEA